VHVAPTYAGSREGFDHFNKSYLQVRNIASSQEKVNYLLRKN
jgi:hypothetical protein